MGRSLNCQSPRYHDAAGRLDHSRRLQGDGVSFLGAVDDGLDAVLFDSLIDYIPCSGGVVEERPDLFLPQRASVYTARRGLENGRRQRSAAVMTPPLRCSCDDSNEFDARHCERVSYTHASLPRLPTLEKRKADGGCAGYLRRSAGLGKQNLDRTTK